MKPILMLYLKIFLYTGVPFGLIMIVADFLDGLGFSWGRLLHYIVYFGGIMSLISGSTHILGLRILGIKKFTETNLSVRQKKQIRSIISPENLMTTIKSDPVFKEMSVTENGNGVLMKSDISLLSWGERIIIKIISQENSLTEYEILSEPILKITFVDAGKNIKNVSRIENILSKANA